MTSPDGLGSTAQESSAADPGAPDAAADGTTAPVIPPAGDTAVSLPEISLPSPSYDATAWIAWLRFVAIVGVVTIHTTGYNAGADGARNTRVGVTAIVLDIGSTFTVPLFVMLSGALLLDPSRFTGTDEFLRKRAIRLIPALVFWHLFYWGFRVGFLHQDVPWANALRDTLNGKLYTALYFFWIILGLAILAPILIPWITTASRRMVIAAGVLACAMPGLTMAFRDVRGVQSPWVESAWTWWVFYAGIFLLGWGLRGVVLRGPVLVIAILGAVGIGANLIWGWRNPDNPHLIAVLNPVSYYGFGVQLYAVLLFLIGQATIREGGWLSLLARGRAGRLGRTLGDATLGVFVLHLAVLGVLTRWSVGGPDRVAHTLPGLMLRLGAVVAVTYCIVLVLRRVPYVRRLL
jgi:surface polysaccharide O-acyltransferase-like enzyme